MFINEKEKLKGQLIDLFLSCKTQISITFTVDVMQLLRKSPAQIQQYRRSASDYLSKLHSYLLSAISTIAESCEQQSQKQHYNRKFINTSIFLKNLPYTKQLYKNFSQLNSDDVGKWIVLVGTVIQSTPKKTLDKSKVFACASCGNQTRVKTSYYNSYQFEIPPACTKLTHKQKANSAISQLFQNLQKRKQKKSQQKQNPQLKLAKCNSKKFDPLDSAKICVDYQQLRVQEQFKFISSGKIPQTLTVILEGDVCGNTTFRPGDDITVTGILTYRYKKLAKDIKLLPQLILITNSIGLQKTGSGSSSSNQPRVQSDNQSQMSKIYANFPMNYYSQYNLTSKERIIIKQLEFRRQIIENFAPSIYGRNMVKLGLILALLGGVSLENSSSKIRGNSHVLLVGQPGTGKSVLLKEISKLSERSFFTNGIGTTSAGLSVSYYKDGGDWMIQAGALVLADNGVCCIDQLTLLSNKDQKSLLECMEQQTISSAKASVIGKLNARTTVICACNPISPGQKYDPDSNLQINTGLSVPLLTRFDLVFIMQDEGDITQDAQKCDYILGKYCSGSFGGTDKSKSPKERINLKSLIRKCKSFNPVMGNTQIFTKYYTEERKCESTVKTARAFESLCRIAEAHSKLMLRDTTMILDYVTAIGLTQNRYFSTIEQYYSFLDQFNKKYGTDFN